MFTTSRRLLTTVSVLIGLVGGVAACGSDNSSSGSGAATTAPASGAATTTGQAATTSGASTTAASDAAWQAVVDAANKEGTVTLYTAHLQNQQDALKAAFNKKYPNIKLEIARVLAELPTKLDAERTTGAAGADVAVGNDAGVPTKLEAGGFLAKLDGPNAAAWAGNKYFVDNTYFVANFNMLGFAWNTSEVKTPPTSYTDFLNPEWKGKIGIVDGGTAAVLADFYAFVTDNTSPDFLTKLAAQQPVIYASSVPLQQAVVAGEVAVGMYSTPSILDDKAKGAPVDFALPTPSWGAPFFAYDLGWSKHPNAAKVLADFIMSPEGQAALAINGTSALEGVKGLTTIDKATPMDNARVAAAAPLMDAWKKTFGR
jgi:iron(III) transport system substrate-binding protein